MKIKRVIVSLTLLVIVVVSAVPVMAAARSKTIKHSGANVELYGYVDFMEGLLFLPDEYACILWLSGDDRGVMIGRSADTKASGTVYKQNIKKKDGVEYVKSEIYLDVYYINDSDPRMTISSVPCGVTGNAVKLHMNCGGTTANVISRE